jgi:hypothetical protein
MAATMDELSAAPFNLGPASGAADFLAWVGLGDRRTPRRDQSLRGLVEARVSHLSFGSLLGLDPPRPSSG